MQVRIFQPPKTAMQSGRAKAGQWFLEFEAEHPRQVEPLMGWTSSRDTQTQLRLSFPSREEAIAYARAHGLMYSVVEPQDRKLQPKSYAANFATDRPLRWTH